MFFNKLSEIERKSFKCHLVYNVVEGILFGFFLMNEFILLKSLQGTEFQVGLLFLFSMVAFLPLLLFNEMLRRTANKRKLIRITAVITRMPLLLFLFFPDSINDSNIVFYHYAFLAIFLVYYLGTPIILPTINLLLRNAYLNNNFGKLFGYATTVNKACVLVATFFFGQLLDLDNYSFRYVYPALGIIGTIGLFYLSAIPISVPKPTIRLKFMAAVKKSGLRLLDILKNDKPYLHYEIAFFLYGIAFMITITVISFFMEKHLGLNYPSIANYKTIGGLITILFLPAFGKLLDKVDPRKLAGLSFTFLLVYVFLVMITEYLPQYFWIGNFQIYYTLIIAFVFFGLFSASNSLAWHIGSAFFSKNNNDAADYQAVHLILTGVRALFAPLTGVLFYSILGYSITFSIAIIFILLSIGIIYWSQKRY